MLHDFNIKKLISVFAVIVLVLTVCFNNGLLKYSTAVAADALPKATHTFSNFGLLDGNYSANNTDNAFSGDISEDVTVKGSTKELEKLLSILLENAVKYSVSLRVTDCAEEEDGMPVPPEINVALRKEGKNAVLEVSNDTENELTNEQLSHVFERFYRMDSSRNSQTGGHGIGLSMANAIVNAHGGHISAHTTNGHDFIVTATFPLQ